MCACACVRMCVSICACMHDVCVCVVHMCVTYMYVYHICLTKFAAALNKYIKFETRPRAFQQNKVSSCRSSDGLC